MVIDRLYDHKLVGENDSKCLSANINNLLFLYKIYSSNSNTTINN